MEQSQNSKKKRGSYLTGKKPAECTLDWCNNKYYAKLLCRYHYERQRLGYPLVKFIPEHTLKCEFEQCDRNREASGLCKAHYMQQYTGKELTPVRTFLRGGDEEGRVCTGCDEFKPWSEFYKHNRKGKNQLQRPLSLASSHWSKCKACTIYSQTIRNRAKQNAQST